MSIMPHRVLPHQREGSTDINWGMCQSNVFCHQQTVSEQVTGPHRAASTDKTADPPPPNPAAKRPVIGGPY
jgi:hypothetical protein